ncbi:MAG TPA: molybdate ABC transporter substrate-binding protein [Clostridia bacterium]|nr:molybdate ABC transporter substrate-binding protein [Clostridia bacterium]
MKQFGKKLLVLSLTLSVLLLTALPVHAADSSAKTELTVFAAASLTESLTAIAELYAAAAPDVTITYNFDSSGTLQTQIEAGAEVDLFLSAAQKQMNALTEGGYILEETKIDLLNNQVVLIVPAGSEIKLESFEAIAGDAVDLVALGNADVPVGQYAEEIFKFLGIWEAVSAKASLGTNVKEVLSQVESGAVDCGVVYATDAATTDGVEVVASAPEGSHTPVVYPAAVLKDSPNIEAAKAFLDFLTTDAAIEAFNAAGFAMYVPPEPEPTATPAS